MHVILATMPWQALETPSLALGILESVLTSRMPGIRVTQYYGNLRWAESICDRHGEETAEVYKAIGEDGIFHGVGDWVFSQALYGTTAPAAGFIDFAARSGIDIGPATDLRADAFRFVEQAAREIAAARPDVVGFTTTFMQNVASLAVAKALKSMLPDVIVVLGGANCDGDMGAALHRNHRFVDYVVRGEGELAFPALLRALTGSGDPATVAGLCWWNGGISTANSMSAGTVPTRMVPKPTYDAWHRQFRQSVVRHLVKPELVVEGARGCWWGEKHHCTFCGLNGSSMAFRSKPADVFLEELTSLVERHRVLDIVPVDNIMSMDYVRDLLPQLAALDWDLRMHYELKANLRRDQIEMLARAGVVEVQFGIESLSSRVLNLMNKGVRGTTNVRVLRDCEELSVTVVWNYLYGFPGEQADDYSVLIAQFPALVHLQPPLGSARIVIERFSPYYDQPELGFGEGRKASEFYSHVYGLPGSELDDLAYFFDAPHRGIDQATAEKLEAAISRWREGYPSSSLLMATIDGGVEIRDRRTGWPEADVVLTGWQEAAYLELARPSSPGRLRSVLMSRGWTISEREVGTFLQAGIEAGLIFAEDHRYLALATTSVSVHAGR